MMIDVLIDFYLQFYLDYPALELNGNYGKRWKTLKTFCKKLSQNFIIFIILSITKIYQYILTFS